MIKYHLSYDGNVRGLFDSEEEAEKYALSEKGWSDDEIRENYEFAKRRCEEYGDSLLDSRGLGGYFIYEIELDENNRVLKVDGLDFDKYLRDTYDVEDERFDREAIESYWNNTQLQLLKKRKAQSK